MEKEKKAFCLGVNYVKDFYKFYNGYISDIIPCGAKTPTDSSTQEWEFSFTCDYHKKNESVDEHFSPISLRVTVLVDLAKEKIVKFYAFPN